MLNRVEVAYLGILRVVLLVAATVALLVTIGAVISAIPALGTVTGLSGQDPIRGGSLREFVDANRISDVQSAADDADTDFQIPLPNTVREASQNFGRYDAKNGGEQLKQDEWNDAFQSILYEKVPALLQGDYGDDVLKLSQQLMRSKGKPLSNERLYQLLQFHLEGFLAHAQAQEAARAAEVAGSMSRLVLAGVAFLIFVLVLFNFIFVKIERNLRPVPAYDQVYE